MADILESIPPEARWAIATKELTGAFVAMSDALAKAVGQKGFEDFNGPLWYGAAQGAKEFADANGLATETAPDIEAVMHLMAKTSMGPEFQFDVTESTKDRCVGTATQCPWHSRWKEQGAKFDCCGAGHQNWGEGAAASLNPAFTFLLTKNMVRGDAHCEWVVERKK
jgi:hypothetical protein